MESVECFLTQTFIHFYGRKEAVVSSQFEGIHPTHGIVKKDCLLRHTL